MESALPTPPTSPTEKACSHCFPEMDYESNLELLANTAIVSEVWEKGHAEDMQVRKRFDEWHQHGQNPWQCDPCRASKGKVI